MNITEHDSFKKCKGQLLSQLVGGSTLYGLDTKDSDIDYRGMFIALDNKYASGLDKIESIVQTGEVDAAYYEITRYLSHLRKSNTQVLEMLFAPDSAFIVKTRIFDLIRENKFNLIDTEVLKNSLKGYVFSELKLATGERSGRLGGKRKQMVADYGFSPKNFVQIFRLCEVGIRFFEDAEYMVNVKEFNPEYHKFLMDIKVNPNLYSKEFLEEEVNKKYLELVEAIESSTVKFEFDIELAASIIIEARKEYGH